VPTQEERLETVEYGLRQFKTETIKAYQEMAIEVTMVKGLTEDAVKRLMNLKVQMDQRFSTIDTRFDSVDQRFSAIDTRLGTIETLLTQILARLPEKP
jgi:hypothetical protein